MSGKPVILHFQGSASIHGGPQRVIDLMMQSSLTQKYTMHAFSPSELSGGIGLPIIREIANAIEHYQADLVHVRGLGLHGFRGLIAGRIAGAKVLMMINGSSRDALNIPKWKKAIISATIEPLSLRFCNGFFPVCCAMNDRPFLRRHWRRNLGVVHNGIPIRALAEPSRQLRAELCIPHDAIVAFYAGRLTKDKGAEVLLNAAKIAVSRHTNLYLVVAGDGDYMSTAGSRITTADWGRNVRLLGHRDDIADLHAISDFFVMATLHENLSNALLEAMHEAKPVITTAVGGNVEVIVDQETGLLVPPSDEHSLAEAMCRLVEHPIEAAEFGRKARIRVEEHFSFNQFIEKIDNLYQKILGETNPD